MLAAAFDRDWPPSVTSDAAATKTASTTNPANLRIEVPFEGPRQEPKAGGRVPDSCFANSNPAAPFVRPSRARQALARRLSPAGRIIRGRRTPTHFKEPVMFRRIVASLGM